MHRELREAHAGFQTLDRVPFRAGIPKHWTSDLEKYEALDPAEWCPRGYAVVNVDGRGVFDSEGDICIVGEQVSHCFILWREPYSRISFVFSKSDGHMSSLGRPRWVRCCRMYRLPALVQWGDWLCRKFISRCRPVVRPPEIELAHVDNNPSSDQCQLNAFQSRHIAAQQPPHLKAIAPWEGFSDLYRELLGRGGIPNPAFVDYRSGYNGEINHLLQPDGSRCPNFVTNRSIFDHPGRNRLEDTGAMIRRHPLYNPYWADKTAKLAQINVPIYALASWSTGLHTEGSIRGFLFSSSKDKWLVKPFR